MLAAPPRVEKVSGSPRLAYRPALDGVRALAVIAVFAYHAEVGWARAGFLGVDVFFVLSGYLITALLLSERRRDGRIDLRRFWLRRARRLLPAVLVLLAVVAVAVPVLAPDQASRIRADLLAALGYVSNWWLIVGQQSYFEAAGRPPLLQHLWSLAVEEQFYLIWPPVLALAVRHRPHRRLVKPLLAAAAVSGLLMAVLFQPYADPSRVYYGTDTRALALLLGAALAAGTARWQLVDHLSGPGRGILEVAGVAGLAGLGWATANVNEFDPLLYRGGFTAVALAAAAVVAAGARPGPPLALGRLLAARPLVWVGQRSYGIYLWFWPVLMVTRPHLDVPLHGAPLLALRAALTVTLAALSYRFVELPARRGAIGRVWADVQRARRTRTPLPRQAAAWGLGLCVVLTGIGVGVAMDGRNRDAITEVAATDVGGLNSSLAAQLATAVPDTTTTVAPPTTAAAEATTTQPSTTVVPTTAMTVPAALPTLTARVTAIGDSVLLGAKPLLEHQIEGVVVDADVGRQFADVLALVRTYRDEGRLGDAVVIQTGNNGPINPAQFDQLLQILRPVPKVLVVNVKVERAWQNANNDVIRDAVPKAPNAVLLDWHALAGAHPDAFYDDGLHLTPSGIRLFTGAVLAALG
ncbi:MAG: acyltransferase family protein [Acidimicrobiia bacterium]